MARYKIVDENGIYFTTHTIVEWLPVFKESKYFQIIIDSLKYCQENKGLHIFGYVIMLTHFHLMGQTEEGVSFPDVMRDMKKFTSKEISSKLENDGQKLFLHVFRKAAEREKGKRVYKIWQDEYHPQVIYTDKVLSAKVRIYTQQSRSEGICGQTGILGFIVAPGIIFREIIPY